MIPWQFTDETERIVFCVDASGVMRSCAVNDVEYQQWLSDGNTTSPAVINPLDFLAQCETAAQEYMDAFARTRGYDNMRAAVTYKDDPYGPFAADGAYALQARSQVWQAAQGIKNQVVAGTMQPPASVSDFLALLPKLAWPA